MMPSSIKTGIQVAQRPRCLSYNNFVRATLQLHGHSTMCKILILVTLWPSIWVVFNAVLICRIINACRDVPNNSSYNILLCLYRSKLLSESKLKKMTERKKLINTASTGTQVDCILLTQQFRTLDAGSHHHMLISIISIFSTDFNVAPEITKLNMPSLAPCRKW